MIKYLLALKYIIFLFIKYKIYKSGKKRYFSIFLHILKNKPIYICEVGVYAGERSNEIIKLSGILNNNKTVYYGFDLFEDITIKKINDEFSKQPLHINKIKEMLNKNSYCNKFYLIKGDTVNTLKEYDFKNKLDLVFIDGGHSIQTINSDFMNLIKKIKEKGIIILDDYYSINKKIIEKAGCNVLINNITKKYSVSLDSQIDTHINKNYGKFGIQLAIIKKFI